MLGFSEHISRLRPPVTRLCCMCACYTYLHLYKNQVSPSDAHNLHSFHVFIASVSVLYIYFLLCASCSGHCEPPVKLAELVSTYRESVNAFSLMSACSKAFKFKSCLSEQKSLKLKHGTLFLWCFITHLMVSSR
jgi:hypothetical protein